MKISDLRRGGHAPSLFSAFLHFDISFMVWVILGALMPFIIADPVLTGENLRITPTAQITRAGQYTVLIKGPQTKAQNPNLTEDQPKNVYNLLVKPGDPTTATRNTVKPVEKYVLDNADPASLAQLNAASKRIQIALAPNAVGNPNENVAALKPLTALRKSGAEYQSIATGYSPAVKLTLVAIPLLAAGFWRLLLGGLVDRFGSKRVGVVSLIFTFVPLVAGWQFGTTYSSLLFIGFFLGLAGASFAIALPLASRWYPPHLQGLAMGIAGAGNSGTVLATIFAPLLAKSFGWHAVFGLLMLPILCVLIVFATLAKDPPAVPGARPSGIKDYFAVLTQSDAWWVLPALLRHLRRLCWAVQFFEHLLCRSVRCPEGGGRPLDLALYYRGFPAASHRRRTRGSAWGHKNAHTAVRHRDRVGCRGRSRDGQLSAGLPAVIVLMGCLGMGNGSVFQLVPQRFRKEIGVMTGLVGAAGGVGGYYLNFALGHLHDSTGSYASGFWAFAAIAFVALAVLRVVAPVWTRIWLSDGGIARTGETNQAEVVSDKERAMSGTTAISPELA